MERREKKHTHELSTELKRTKNTTNAATPYLFIEFSFDVSLSGFALVTAEPNAAKFRADAQYERTSTYKKAAENEKERDAHQYRMTKFTQFERSDSRLRSVRWLAASLASGSRSAGAQRCVAELFVDGATCERHINMRQ